MNHTRTKAHFVDPHSHYTPTCLQLGTGSRALHGDLMGLSACGARTALHVLQKGRETKAYRSLPTALHVCQAIRPRCPCHPHKSSKIPLHPRQHLHPVLVLRPLPDAQDVHGGLGEDEPLDVVVQGEALQALARGAHVLAPPQQLAHRRQRHCSGGASRVCVARSPRIPWQDNSRNCRQ